MPEVNGKHFPYTAKGKKAAKKAAQMMGSKKGDPSKTRPGDEDYEAHKGTKSKDDPDDKPDFTTGARKGDKSKTHKGKDFEKKNEGYANVFTAYLNHLREEKDWIQKAVNPAHKGYCTPMTKSTCTPARKALAKRFKKAGRKEKKEGGTGWQGKV